MLELAKIEWNFVYNPKVDIWEIISNNGWASKSMVEDSIREMQQLDVASQRLKDTVKEISDMYDKSSDYDFEGFIYVLGRVLDRLKENSN